jgi:hypothetical protein
MCVFLYVSVRDAVQRERERERKENKREREREE